MRTINKSPNSEHTSNLPTPAGKTSGRRLRSQAPSKRESDTEICPTCEDDPVDSETGDICPTCDGACVIPVTDGPVSKSDNTPHTEAVPTVAPISDADSPARYVRRCVCGNYHCAGDC